jgi:hypothetical protein
MVIDDKFAVREEASGMMTRGNVIRRGADIGWLPVMRMALGGGAKESDFKSGVSLKRGVGIVQCKSGQISCGDAPITVQLTSGQSLATRFEKLARNFKAIAYLACTIT